MARQNENSAAKPLARERQHFGGDNVVVSIGADAVIGFGGIIARLLDTLQVIRTDVAGDIDAIEARSVETIDVRIAFARSTDQIFLVLIDQPIGADLARDFFVGASVGD